MSITSSGFQRRVTTVRFGWATSASSGTTDEVVIEFAHAVPADLNGSAIARAQVGWIDAARDLEELTDERPRHFIGHAGDGNEGPGDLGKSAFDVIHQVSSPAQPLDAEVAACAVYRVVDLGAIFDGAMQLVCEVAGHTDARDLDLDAVDVAFAEAQEADAPEALPVTFSSVFSDVGPAIWNR